MVNSVAGAHEPDRYRDALTRWLPGVRATPGRATAPTRMEWPGPAGLVELRLHEVPHLGTRDVHLIARQVNATAVEPHATAAARPCHLLLAPYVRRQQAEVLERARIGYVDLAGNAHFELPGLHVHVEGKRPARTTPTAVAITPGWVRFVLALLVRPQLAQAPYRTVAAQAGVALGAVPRYRRDLARRGFLQGTGDRTRVARHEELMAAWVHGYATTLRPRLLEQRFQTPATARHDLRERLRDTLADRGLPWTLTGAAGTIAVDRHLETADTRVYAPRNAWTPELLRTLRLQPVVTDGALVAIEAPGPLALEAVVVGGWPCAALPLVYAELRYIDTDQAREAADRLMPRLLQGLA